MRCAQYTGVHFESPTFPKICNGLLFWSILRMCIQNWKFVALPVREIIGGTDKKFLQSQYMPTLPFLQNFSWACVQMDPVNVSAKFAVRSFSRSWDNTIAVLGWGCKPPILGKGGRRGSGMVPFERSFVTSYRLSIVTFPLSLPVSEILPLLCSSTPLFPTPPLVSPNFPMFPWD